VPREAIVFGPLLVDACASLGISVEDYLDRYDPTLARPFDGVDDLLAALDSWAVCSHKIRASGVAELDRLAWAPELALFAEDFGPTGKTLAPVLDALGLRGDDIVFVGDTAHDRACAAAAGAVFVLAGWNPRAEAAPGDLVAATPGDVLAILRG
jgi:phosphoglycolate phosphatase-like HAD superfamily hydrolase